jgi:Family of unknown function (DUF6788)
VNSNLTQLQQRREQILQEMAAIDRLRRGHLSEQYFKSNHRGKTLRQGPYYVLQRWFQGKNLCERVPAQEVDRGLSCPAPLLMERQLISLRRN